MAWIFMHHASSFCAPAAMRVNGLKEISVPLYTSEENREEMITSAETYERLDIRSYNIALLYVYTYVHTYRTDFVVDSPPHQNIEYVYM